MPYSPKEREELLPEEPGIAHAVRRRGYRKDGGRPQRPEFLTSRSYEQALCGATVKVLLPIDFDPGDPDGCQRCAAHLHNSTSAPLYRPEELIESP